MASSAKSRETARGVLLLYSLVTVISCTCATDPSFPDPGTGTPNCINPIRQVICTVDTRTGFVAGLEYGAGPQFGTRAVCSRGNRAVAWFPQTLDQTTWDMTDLADPSFPKNTTQQPNLEYYFPLGGLISQMIVLSAPNPLGPTFGDIPAIIFRYYTPLTAQIGMAVCGNALYANAYLYPFGSRLPPTPVSLKSVFVNPLSATTPAFLSSFQGKCAPRGTGYLGGAPYTSSPYHLLNVFKVCFAPASNVVNFLPPTVQPRPPVSYDWDAPYRPCYYDKKDAKQSTSYSCAASGQTVATGKWGAIYVDPSDSTAYEMVPGAEGKASRQKWNGQVYEGSEPGEVLNS